MARIRETIRLKSVHINGFSRRINDKIKRLTISLIEIVNP